LKKSRLKWAALVKVWMTSLATTPPRRPLGLSRHQSLQELHRSERAFDEDAMKKQLWPDQATYQKEEQRKV